MGDLYKIIQALLSSEPYYKLLKLEEEKNLKIKEK